MTACFSLCFPHAAWLQEFSADMNSRPVKRIEDVCALRAAQFSEDSGEKGDCTHRLDCLHVQQYMLHAYAGLPEQVQADSRVPEHAGCCKLLWGGSERAARRARRVRNFQACQ